MATVVITMSSLLTRSKNEADDQARFNWLERVLRVSRTVSFFVIDRQRRGQARTPVFGIEELAHSGEGERPDECMSCLQDASL
jgi:hypothetical protein